MMSSFEIGDIKGTKVNRVFAVFFSEKFGASPIPISLVFRLANDDIVEMMPNGDGGISFGRDPFRGICHDESGGLSFVAPLSLIVEKLCGLEDIITNSNTCFEFDRTKLILEYDSDCQLEIMFLEDDIFVIGD